MRRYRRSCDCLSWRQSLTRPGPPSREGAGGAAGQSQSGGGFFHGQTREKPQFHQLDTLRLNGSKSIKGLVQVKQVLIRGRGGVTEEVKIDAPPTSAAFQPALMTPRHTRPGIAIQEILCASISNPGILSRGASSGGNETCQASKPDSSLP
jgi:hypothetical protein